MNIAVTAKRLRTISGLLVPGIALAMLLSSCGPSKEAAVSPPPEKKALTSTFKILSINARHTLKEKSDVRKLSKLIKSTGAEIVAVQQIEKPEDGKEGFDAVKELAKQTDMYNFFGKARFLDGFDSGNALLSLYPVKSTTVHPLPVGKGKVRRSLTFGVVDVGLRSVDVGTTELDDQSPAERVSQTEELYSIAKSYSDELFIVCGSFYETMSGKAAAKMQDHFSAANELQESTRSAEQQLYVMKSEKIQPISAEKVRLGGGVDGLLVTIRVSQ